MSKCPWCGAPTDNNSKYNGMGFNQSGRFGYYVYTCGYSTNPDFNRGCSNRNQRTERDEITQPPEPDHEEQMSEETTSNTAELASEPSYPEVSTLPAIRPLVQESLAKLGLAVEVVERLKGYGNLVLADVTDKKSADKIDEARKEVKKFRCAWTNACKEGRADANAIADAWLKAQKTLVDDFEKVEAHLEAQFELHEEWKREEKRKVEQARIERARVRVEAVVAAGAPLDLQKVETLNDEEWSAYLGDLVESKRLLDAATAVAAELSALGDECTPAEALQLTEEQIEHRLGVARKADHDRKEAARLKEEEEAAERQRIADEEKASRERLERGYRRGRELALVGAIGFEVETLADMSEADFIAELERATEAKIENDRLAAEAARIQREKDEELERLRKEDADRREAERQAMEQRERDAIEANRIAEEQARQEREQAEAEESARLERERLEALRPDREKIVAWAKAALESLPALPTLSDEGLHVEAKAAAAGVAGILEEIVAKMGGEA